jgi:hypothetical protein
MQNLLLSDLSHDEHKVWKLLHVAMLTDLITLKPFCRNAIKIENKLEKIQLLTQIT